jgi:phage-related baseplate assembly protein
MAGAFTTVNLAELAAPGVVETLSFEAILSAMLTDLQGRDTAFTALVESDPAYKILQVAAYRELLLRQRVNEAARATMLAFATGTDLDHRGANFNVPRLLIDAGDPDAIPPVPPTYEPDNAYRQRIPLSLEGYTTAGSEGSYVFHGLSASGGVKDVSAVSPTPGQVTVYVLANEGNGTADSELLDAVEAALNAETVRPMTDQVTVLSATIVNYTVQAVLTLYPGPSSDVVLAAAQAAVDQFVADNHRIGFDVNRSALFAALHQPGVQNVTLTTPAANIVVSDGQAAFCTGVNITVGGTGV